MKCHFNIHDKYIKHLIFAATFSAIFIRYIYYGFRYYYQLDDYIQYHNFATSNDYGQLIIKEGFLAARPLAGISDLYIWSSFFENMLLAVLIISLMYAFSAILFFSVFRKLFGTGLFFIAVYTLLPLGFEGTYWMSASTRIVAGLFFTSVSAAVFQKICETGKIRYVPAWMIIQLVSFCFYEQVLVFSLTITVIVMIINLRIAYRNKSKTKSPWGLLSAVNIINYFAFTGIFENKGMYATRMEMIFPTTPYYYDVFLPEITRQIGAAFLKGGMLTLIKGFYRGIYLAAGNFNWLYFSLLLFIVMLYFLISKKITGTEQTNAVLHYPYAIIYGVILASAPVMPFLIVGNPWFSLRNTVCSFIGIALAADAFLRFVFSGKKNASSFCTAVFVFICCISSVSELHDYKATYEYDRKISNIIAEEIKGETHLGRIGILNLNASYLDDQNYFYHEHIHGITENSWALFGGLASISNEIYSEVIPLATDGFSYYTGWNREIKKIDNFDTLYFWDEKREVLSRLTARRTGETSYILLYEDKTKCALVWEEDGYGYIEIYKSRICG